MNVLMRRGLTIATVFIITLGCTPGDSRPRPPSDIFVAPVNYAVGEGPTCVVAADFTGDGNLDLITCDSGGNTVTVLPGNGDGSFNDPITTPVSAQPQRMAVGEFTGDTALDLALIHSSTALLTFLRGTGDGRFQEFQRISVERTPTDVLQGDFNGDRHSDVAVSLRMDRIMIFSGSGRSFFALTHTFDPGDTPTGISTADINKDGIPDIIAANNGIVGRSVATFYGNGDGTFKKGFAKSTPLVPLLARAGDFSKDGILDLAVIYGERNTLALLLGNPDGSFGDPKPFGAEGGPADMVLDDFNRDGNLDLAVPNNLSHNLSIVLGQGDGSFYQPPVDYQTQKVPFSVARGVFIEGGPPGLAVANNGSGTVTVFLPKLTPSSPASRTEN